MTKPNSACLELPLAKALGNKTAIPIDPLKNLGSEMS
jgi:hypothetical protein